MTRSALAARIRVRLVRARVRSTALCSFDHVPAIAKAHARALEVEFRLWHALAKFGLVPTSDLAWSTVITSDAEWQRRISTPAVAMRSKYSALAEGTQS